MTTNLIVFSVSVLAIGVGVASAVGWAWALVVVGSIVAVVTLVATLARGK
jgi:hypothetical protein